MKPAVVKFVVEMAERVNLETIIKSSREMLQYNQRTNNCNPGLPYQGNAGGGGGGGADVYTGPSRRRLRPRSLPKQQLPELTIIGMIGHNDDDDDDDDDDDMDDKATPDLSYGNQLLNWMTTTPRRVLKGGGGGGGQHREQNQKQTTY